MSCLWNQHTLRERYNMDVQETNADVSRNSNECDNPDRMQPLKESVRQSGCFVPHGKRLVTPLISLSQIQENILSQSDIERRRLQYDNAWNVLETGDSRLSNHYKPSVTTKQLNTSYVFVGSVQETTQKVKSHPTPSSSLTDDISRYSGDTDEYMPKSKKHCSMKRICKYILWILIFLGISAVVAMLSVNNQNSKANQSVNSMEAQTGNNEINKTLTSVLEKLDSIKKSIESMKTLPEENNTYVNATNNMPYQTSQGYSSTRSGPDSGGPCQKNTTRGCVEFKKCYLMCDGDYQACGPCTAYVTCANRHGWERNCTNDDHDHILFWNDIRKRCDTTSDTCVN
eukprot:XP_019920560.1 PREDICTED: uncharacterized protein LOC105322990 isoform X2 [Crassostrea gigas]